MKKLICLIVSLFVLTGCGSDSPKMAVERYLSSYINLDSNVIQSIENEIDKNSELTEEQKNTYRNILEKQYKDLSYQVTKEETEKDKAYVTVKISVYDLYKAQSDASNHLKEHKDEFYIDNKYDASKYMDYKLEQMKNMTDKVEYDIVFTLTKEDGKYVVNQPSETDLERIHGIYNYNVD